ncbi:glycerol-3-phosphate dehydrogenase (NAD(P)+) [Selenomonas sp. GACV-9]|uniref:NAD(P)H-dependent glycerol-3-phosphate dehydrogenase n=1 Tax=Selenomonas sp. GACV-9 TaxID=3158782 RepID=UPI0008E9C015|nr:glycerol-3-phosphate dehydrogenase (NAD(P)+) [Selenomonas ruminantium]
MKVTVLGCGRWGTFHAWYANHIGHDVLLWGRKGSKHLQELRETRKNEYLELPESVALTEDIREALDFADTIVISISSQQLRGFAGQLAELGVLTGKRFVLCMKGLEIGTGKRLTTVFREAVGSEVPVAVWVGPGHVQDFTRGIPNCMVIAAADMQLTKELVDAFSSPLIRFYYGEDLLGTEIGAAAKNVIGLAAGMLDGFGYGSLKGALMARGTRELSRLIEKMGGDKMTVYGLSHLGDYEATLFSPHSNNRRFGEDLITGKPFSKLAEGVYTVEALMALAGEYHAELPICETVYEIVHNHKDPKEQLTQLFMRSTKSEQA